MGDQVVPSVQFELNPQIWFIDRKMQYKPLHFITVNTPLTAQSALWIIHNLVGRFTFHGNIDMDDDFEECTLPSFEDPVEAVLYELKWS